MSGALFGQRSGLRRRCAGLFTRVNSRFAFARVNSLFLFTRVNTDPARGSRSVAMSLSRSMRIVLLCMMLLALGAAPAGATIFGLLDTGELYASDDDASTWTIRSTLPVSDAIGLAAGTTTAELFLVSETGTFYRSTDSGTNWTAMGSVTASDVAAMVPFSDRVLVITATGTVYKTTDNGATFTGIGGITASDVVAATRSLAITFALTRTGTVYRSHDAGVSWSAVGGITTSSAEALTELNGSLYALTAEGLVAKSDDEGVSWSFVSTLSQVGMTSLLTRTPDLFVSTEAGEVAKSGDGVVWTWEGTMNQVTVRALAHDVPTQIGVEVPPVTPVLRFIGPWPNPAGSSTNLVFELERETVITVEVFDAQGRRVAQPVLAERFHEGTATRTWRPGRLTNGIYYIRAVLGETVETKKLVWLKR
jgi:photosystem II stability/assembly factor-like uncharacterized protein